MVYGALVLTMNFTVVVSQLKICIVVVNWLRWQLGRAWRQIRLRCPR